MHLLELLSLKAVRNVEEKFNIFVDSLEFLGSGAYGIAFGIDDYSVLKVTWSDLEQHAVTRLIETGLISEPGFAAIAPGDTLWIEEYFIYRTERLIPFELALEWLGKGDEKFIKSKIIESKLRHLNSVAIRAAGSNLSISDTAELFLRRTQDLDISNTPMLATLVLSLHQAALTGLFLWDTGPDNVGFRFNEDRKTPALDAGVVFFDPMVWKID